MRSYRIVLAAVAILVVLAAPPAEADFITQSILTSGRTGHMSHFAGSFDQFDPALGTLDVVTLNFAGSITYNTTFVLDPDRCNLGVCSAQYTYSTGYSFNAPGFPYHDPNGNPFYAIANSSGLVDGSDLSPRTSGPIPLIFGPFSADPGSIASYIGTGTVYVDGRVSEDSDECYSFGVRCMLSDNLNLVSTLTYAFTPIPEPSSWAIMLAGLVAVRAASRRRRLLTKTLF